MDKPIYWRGSVTDLATDIAGTLTSEQARQLVEALEKELGGKRRLTREQGAIVSAFTGFLAGPFEDMHALAEKKFGQPIWTHQFADEKVSKRLRELTREDFVAIVAVKP